MNPAIFYFFLFMSCFVLTAVGTGLLINLLKKHKILLDKPNHRSNHQNPIPRGGGIAIITIISVTFLFISIYWNKDFILVWPVFAAMLFLAVVSLVDDVKGLKPLLRFVTQVIAVAAGLYVMYSITGRIILLSPFPLWLDVFLAAFIWLWFINLYNFMDGIDGITSAETVAICLGICAITMFASLGKGPFTYSLVIAGTVLGFLIWNWHPARIFMGDVGSIPLGFMLGWLLLYLTASGNLAGVLIFSAYYLSDGTITLARRLIKGNKPWEAHSEHFYQLAVRSGMKHSSVVLLVSTLNFLLFFMGVASLLFDKYALLMVITAYLLVFALLYFFQSSLKRKTK